MENLKLSSHNGIIKLYSLGNCFIRTGILFAILLVAFLVITSIKKERRVTSNLTILYLFTIFLVLKIVGGILGLVFIHQKLFNVSLFIPTFIFDSIGLGFIARSITSLVTHNFKYQDDLPEFLDQNTKRLK